MREIGVTMMVMYPTGDYRMPCRANNVRLTQPTTYVYVSRLFGAE